MAHDERREIAREGLRRVMPFTLDRAAGQGGDGLTLEGHAAVFNSPTVIDSWEGRFREQTAPGAFKKTFQERTPVLQFDHGHHPLIGSIPIGRINSAKEDSKGAAIKARLADNWLIQPVRDAIANESINGMSFRFSVVREEWRDADGNLVTDPQKILRAIYSSDGLPESQLMLRTLREVKVPELGPVVFPAYEATDVGVRSGRTVIDLSTLRKDPDARKQLARTLFLAEQGNTAEDTEDGQDEDARRAADANAELQRTTDELTEASQQADAVEAIRQVGVAISEQLTLLAQLVVGQRSKPAKPTTDGPAEDGERADTTDDEPGADGTHSDPGQPTDDGHRSGDSAPVERHAEEHDEPPEGHSSPQIRPTVATREGRRATLAYIEAAWQQETEKQSIHQRSVERYEQACAQNKE